MVFIFTNLSEAWSHGNTSAGLPHQSFPHLLPKPSPEPCCPWCGSAPKPPSLRQNLLRNPVEPDLVWIEASPDLLRNLFRNLLRNPVELDLALHQSLPDLLQNLPRNPVELDLALHQGFLEPSPQPCWTWPGSAPKPPDLLQNLRNLLRNLLRNPVERDLALHQSLLQAFSGTFGTFYGTSLNLTRRLHQCTPELFWAEEAISLRCCIKMAPTDGYFFPLFLCLLELNLNKGSFEHGKAWFGRRFYCLVNVNLHNLPCTCIKMALTDSFFTFLVVVGIRGEKGSFEHGKTWFGRRFCCLVIYANFHNLPLYMHQNGSDRFFFHFSCGCWD